MGTNYGLLGDGSSQDRPVVSERRIRRLNPNASNGLYWMKPAGYTGSAQQVYVDFDGSESGIGFPGPWVRIRYAQDYFSRTSPWQGQGSGATTSFDFEQPDAFIQALIDTAEEIDIRQRFESWGNGSVGWTYGSAFMRGQKFDRSSTYYDKDSFPSTLTMGFTNFTTFGLGSSYTRGDDPTDTNDGTWRVGVAYFRDIQGDILPFSGIFHNDVDGASESRYFPFRNGEATPGENSDIWISTTKIQSF